MVISIHTTKKDGTKKRNVAGAKIVEIRIIIDLPDLCNTSSQTAVRD